MKVFIAGLDTETNTYSPIPTGYASFDELLIAHGDATSRPLNHCSAQLAVWKQEAHSRGYGLVESLCAVAEPGGIVSQAVYERFREEILADLSEALPVDFVVLALHGAMVAQGYEDVEGDLLSKVREIVGPAVPVGAELDLHAHLTAQMVGSADILLAYKEYPHTDIEECARKLFVLMEGAAMRRHRPTMAMFDCRMLGIFRTQDAPLRHFVDRMKAYEGRNGILSVSLIHGFPWADVHDVGTKVLVVADGDVTLAAALAESLGQEVWNMREAIAASGLSVKEALDRAAAEQGGPVVLADVSDNPGGGAPGDSTFLLREVIKRKFFSVVSALHWDPVAVRFCQDAGEGAVIDLRIGGKAGVSSGEPLDLKVRVNRLASGLTQQFGTASLPIGDVAWVSCEGVDIILNTQRTQVFEPGFMSALGLDPSTRKFILVKSTNHFYAAFSPIAKTVLFVDAPGALARDFRALRRHCTVRHLWPLHPDPLKRA